MNELLFKFLASVLGVGLLFSIPALIVEKILIIKGVARGSSIALVIGSFFAALYKQVHPEPLYWLLGVFAVVFGPLIVNRTDVYYTVKKGRWWWKLEKEG